MSNSCCWNTLTATDVTVSTTEVTITIPATTFKEYISDFDKATKKYLKKMT